MPYGKCDQCQVRWEWTGRPRVADALCLCCHGPLTVTSQNSLLKCYSAYAVSFNGRPRYLTVDPTVISKLRRDLKKRSTTCRH